MDGWMGVYVCGFEPVIFCREKKVERVSLGDNCNHTKSLIGEISLVLIPDNMNLVTYILHGASAVLGSLLQKVMHSKVLFTFLTTN